MSAAPSGPCDGIAASRRHGEPKPRNAQRGDCSVLWRAVPAWVPAGPALAGTQGADGRRLSGGTALPAGLRQAWAPCRRVCSSQAPVCGTIAVGRGPSRDGSVWGGAREPAFERGPRRRRGCWPWDHDGARTDRHGGRPALLWGRTGARGWPGRGRAEGGGEWVAGMLAPPPPVHAAPAHAPSPHARGCPARPCASAQPPSLRRKLLLPGALPGSILLDSAQTFPFRDYTTAVPGCVSFAGLLIPVE